AALRRPQPATLSLHDALPISLAARLRSLGRLTARGLPGVRVMQVGRADAPATEEFQTLGEDLLQLIDRTPLQQHVPMRTSRFVRSEEHTSELQSRFDLVCRLL